MVTTYSAGSQLDVLQGYAAKWRLTVNIGKIKTVVFQGRKTQVDLFKPMYAGANFEVVESFRYLGLDLHCTKELGNAGSARSEAAGRSEWALSGRCSELGIEAPALKLHLWDALVRPCMLYGVEVWGPRS